MSAFALGKLGDDEIGVIAEHLTECALCRAGAAAATDNFLELVRASAVRTVPAAADPTPAVVPLGDADHPPARHAPPVPAELCDHPRYRILHPLGQGGMGAVYLAEHRVLKQPRAIKVVKRARVGDSEAVERFLQEIEMLARLHHANIVHAYDAERIGESILLAMELVEGQTLAALLKERGPLPVGLACDFVRQAALGLQHAFERGLVHRDIKPSNLMLTSEGVVKILDFGLARLATGVRSDPGLTPEHVHLGTPEYMAPEQILDARQADTRADVYALGCTLFCLLTGRPPFGGETAMQVSLAHLQDPLPGLSKLRPEVPAELSMLVQQMLAKKLEQRPQTPGEVACRLVAFTTHEAGTQDGLSTAAPSPGSARPTPSPTEGQRPLKAATGMTRPARRRYGLRGVALALAFLGVLALALWGTGTLRVRTPHGTIVLEQLPPGAEVLVDGERVTLKRPGAGGAIEIRVQPGRRQLEVKKDGFRVFSRELALDAGGREPVTVRLEPLAAEEARPKEPEKGPPRGFIPLFNGKDLSGWRAWGGGTGGWEVADGAIVGRGECRILYSDRGDFEDFHLSAEALIDDGGRSGILFRSPYTPHNPYAYQVGINISHPDPQKTGSVYGFAPVAEQLHKPDEWFALEVIAQGERLVTKVNGRVTADCRDRSFKKGHLALLANYAGGVVKFRKIDIQPLPPLRKPFRSPAGGDFVPLFNGKDLAGWQAPSGGSGGWNVEDGILVARGPVQNLYSEYGHFEDFHLRAEARINDGGFARVGFRAYWAAHPGIPQAYYAVINATNTSPERTGSMAGLDPVTERHHRPDEWLTLEVIARGNRLTLKVNGKTTLDCEQPRFRMGHVLLEQRTPDSEIRFRKIEIKDLASGK